MVTAILKLCFRRTILIRRTELPFVSYREGEKEMGYWEKGDTKAHINKVHAPEAKENT